MSKKIDCSSGCIPLPEVRITAKERRDVLTHVLKSTSDTAVRRDIKKALERTKGK